MNKSGERDQERWRKGDYRLWVNVPKEYQEEQLLERLQRIANREDRSLSYMIVQAILEYLEREEQDG